MHHQRASARTGRWLAVAHLDPIQCQPSAAAYHQEAEWRSVGAVAADDKAVAREGDCAGDGGQSVVAATVRLYQAHCTREHDRILAGAGAAAGHRAVAVGSLDRLHQRAARVDIEIGRNEDRG